VNRLEVHTLGELHPEPAGIARPDLVLNLSRLLDDPARKPDAELRKATGLDLRIQNFVWQTEGAYELYADTRELVYKRLQRGPLVVWVMCRGGRHRSVVFGSQLARDLNAAMLMHWHIDLPVVTR
jgi:RNase adaptor protein for sRNA GlmZ degradation